MSNKVLWSEMVIRVYVNGDEEALDDRDFDEFDDAVNDLRAKLEMLIRSNNTERIKYAIE